MIGWTGRDLAARCRGLNTGTPFPGVEPNRSSLVGRPARGEGYFRYRNAKSVVTTASRRYVYHYRRLSVELEMGEEEWVKEAARLCGVNCRRDSKGKYWRMAVEGSRAISVVRAIRPYLYGFKAAAADIILANPPNMPAKRQRPRLPSLKGKVKMDREGFGPSTSRVQGERSTAELPAHRRRSPKRPLLSFPK